MAISTKLRVTTVCACTKQKKELVKVLKDAQFFSARDESSALHGRGFTEYPKRAKRSAVITTNTT